MIVETSHQVFWRHQFPHPVELVSLPLDHSRPPVPSYMRDTTELVLDLSVGSGLCQLGSHLSAPPLAVLLAALGTVLFRYSGQETFVVGAVAQANGLEGASARNGLPLLPIQTNGPFLKEVSGQGLVRELARCLAEAEAHVEYPLRELQSWAGVPDAAFGHRLFNVALCLADVSSRSPSGWPVSDPDLSEFLTQCDVALTVMSSASEVTLLADFDSDLFEKGTIIRLLGHVGMILDGMIRDPSIPVIKLPILTPAERQQLLVEWNPGQARRPSYETLHQWFESQVVRTPEALALTCEQQSLTYLELNQRANRLAHALRERGVGPESIVGLCWTDRWSWWSVSSPFLRLAAHICPSTFRIPRNVSHSCWTMPRRCSL